MPSSMPNVLFGSFGLRHYVDLFFPLLQADGRDKNNHLNEEELADLYNLAIIPVATIVLKWSCHNWPASFAAAQTKYCNTHGGFTNSSHPISGKFLLLLSQEIWWQIHYHEELTWARYFFWRTEICGTKDLTHHNICVQVGDRQAMLYRLTKGLYIEEGTWYVDVGLEFLKEEKALIWSMDANAQVLTEALEIDIADAHSFVQKRQHFSQDTLTHILSLGGWHAWWDYGDEPGVGENGVVFGQAYTTDKIQTYHPEYGRYEKTLTAKAAMSSNPSKWYQNILDIYNDAAATMDVAAWLELWCQLDNALCCMASFSPDVIRNALVSYQHELWW